MKNKLCWRSISLDRRKERLGNKSINNFHSNFFVTFCNIKGAIFRVFSCRCWHKNRTMPRFKFGLMIIWMDAFYNICLGVLKSKSIRSFINFFIFIVYVKIWSLRSRNHEINDELNT